MKKPLLTNFICLWALCISLLSNAGEPFKIPYTYGDKTYNQSYTSLNVFISYNILNNYQNFKPIPGKIEAESFDSHQGVSVTNTSDVGGGKQLSGIESSDWVTYNVKVNKAGEYIFDFRVLSENGKEGIFEIQTVSGKILKQVNFEAITANTWQTLSTTVNLPSGNQTIKFVVKAGIWSFNWLEVKALTNNSTPSSSQQKQSAINFPALPNKTAGEAAYDLVASSNNTLTPITFTSSNPSIVSVSSVNGVWKATPLSTGTSIITASQTGKANYLAAPDVTQNQVVFVAPSSGNTSYVVPGKIEAENFIAMFGIQTESTVDVGGGLNVGYISDGDWMDYNLEVATAGTFDFYFRVANAWGLGAIQIRSDKGVVLGTVDIPRTGGWQNFTTISATATLPAGKQIIRIYAAKGDWNFNWFEVISKIGTASSLLISQQKQSAINFPALPNKTVGEAAYDLVASSNNTLTPITFTSSNPSIVSVSSVNGVWKATPLSAGTAIITASQTGNATYLAAPNVTQNQVVITTPITGSSQSGKIPMEAKRWYQINTVGDGMTATTGLKQMTDGILYQTAFNGWGKFFSNYDSYYEFVGLADVKISKIRFYDCTYGSFENQPFKVYAKTSLSAQPVLLATYVGNNNGSWKEINLPAPVSAKYLMINSYWGFPDEMELYGTYKESIKPVLAAQKDIRLKDMFGVNSFIWDFMQSWQDLNIREAVYEPKMALMQAFSQFRDYVDWQKIELSEGVFTFNPTEEGSWDYDIMYKRLKAEGKEILPCFKTLPIWFLEKNYPAHMRDAENIPARYGSNLMDPASYIAQAKAGFQFVARYGSTKVDLSLLSGVVTGKLYPTAANSPVRTRETGMGLIKYIECENERDKWWKGRKAYQTGFEYAANLSAFYDGHKNTLGSGIGVKNADPNIKVVIGGIASDRTDYIRAIIDWCKEYRGYKPDGSIDLCFDVINYHMYASDASTSQGGTSTRGVAPEVSWSGIMADAFVDLARENNVEVWITETGYDITASSPQKAIAIGSKTVLDVQADWILRTALNNARHGINKTFMYQSYDDNLNGWGLFVSSGLLDAIAKKRKPSGDFLYQANKKFGEYVYRQTLNSDPIVDRYELNGNSAYVLVVPDEKGRTANYTLDLGNAASAYIYTPKSAADSMDRRLVNTVNGKLTLTVTETPVFVQASGAIIPGLMSTANKGMALMASDPRASRNHADVPNKTFHLFPNPANDFITVQFQTKNVTPVQARIINVGSGVTHKSFEWTKPMFINERINIKSLPSGSYLLEIKQGSNKIVKKFEKLSQ